MPVARITATLTPAMIEKRSKTLARMRKRCGLVKCGARRASAAGACTSAPSQVAEASEVEIVGRRAPELAGVDGAVADHRVREEGGGRGEHQHGEPDPARTMRGPPRKSGAAPASATRSSTGAPAGTGPVRNRREVLDDAGGGAESETVRRMRKADDDERHAAGARGRGRPRRARWRPVISAKSSSSRNEAAGRMPAKSMNAAPSTVARERSASHLSAESMLLGRSLPPLTVAPPSDVERDARREACRPR